MRVLGSDTDLFAASWVSALFTFPVIQYFTKWYCKLTYSATSAEWRRTGCREGYDWLNFIELFEMSYSSNWGFSYNRVYFFLWMRVWISKGYLSAFGISLLFFPLNDLEYLGLLCGSCGQTSSMITLMQGVADWNVEANQKKTKFILCEYREKSRQLNYFNIKCERSKKKVFWKMHLGQVSK